MDPQATWNELLEARLNRDWNRAEELADALLVWLQRRGFPPHTVGDPKLGTRWHHAVTYFVCHLVLADVKQARTRAERRRA
jgi:hypothetical protein